MFLISQSSHVVGHAYLVVLVIDTALYTLFFLCARIFSIFALSKTPRPIPTEVKNQAFANGIVKLSALVGGLCFIVGDNILTVVALDTEDLNCDEDCLHAVGDTATMLLVIASLLFSINEIHGGKLLVFIRNLSNSFSNDNDEDDDNEWHMWGTLAELIAFIRVFHSSYATIASLQAEVSNGCESYEFSISRIIFILLMIIWTALTIVIMGPGIIRSVRNHDIKEFFQIFAITSLVIFATGFLMIGSNNEPLSCAFDCQVFFSNNFTTDCNETNYHTTRILLLSLSLIILTPLCMHLSVRFIKLTYKLKKLGNDRSSLENVEMSEFENNVTEYRRITQTL